MTYATHILAVSFLAPLGAWLFALIVPLVALYFLKLRRDRLRVPSLVLWQQVINDSRVNSPFQRFKRNLLLLLQLILLILLILAAMQPYMRGDVDDIDRLPILIDTSASMSALDAPDGETRLDAAKEHIRGVIEELHPDQELALIAFGRSARLMTGFTSNKRVLLDALEKIETTDVASDMTDGLRMAEAMWRSNGFEKALLLTDGNVPAETDVALPFELTFQRLPEAGRNVGITALNARRAADGRWNVFVNVQGTNHEHPPAKLQLVRDGEIIAEEGVALSPAGSQRLVFPLPAQSGNMSLGLRLLPQRFDALPADNVAFLELNASRDLRVWVAPGLDGYRDALEAMEGVTVYPRRNTPEPTAFDLVVSDDESQPAKPWRTALFVGVVPQEVAALVTIKSAATTIVDWDRTTPLLEHVELTDLLVLDQPVLNPGVTQTSFEDKHYEYLAQASQTGPLILRKRGDATTAWYLLFHSDRSTLPYRLGFPILVANAVRVAMLQAGLLEVAGDTTGVLPAVTLNPETEYTVTGPDDFTRDIKTDNAGLVSGVATPRVGAYTVTRGGKVEHRVGVSLLDARESSLAPAQRINVGELSVDAETQTPRTNALLWPVLALLALCVLLCEWWYFQRRPGGWTR